MTTNPRYVDAGPPVEILSAPSWLVTIQPKPRTVAAELQRLAGHDVTPGHDELHRYWTKGEGLAKWVHSAHPWTALYHHLVKHVPPEMAKRMASAWFREVLGFWPGEKHIGAVKVGRSALIRAVVRAAIDDMLSGDEDDDPVGELDEQTLALLQAMSELDAEYAGNVTRAAKWDPAKHPKGPDGRFLSVVDRIKAAIKEHQAGKGKGDPLKDFDRPQLLNAAKARGIPLKRGEDRDSIAAKLLADIGKAKTAGAKKPAAPKAPKAAVKDDLDKLNHEDLHDLAAEYGIQDHGKSRAEVIAAIRRKQKAEKAALAKEAAKRPPEIPATGKAAKFHRNLNGIDDLQKTVDGATITDEKHLAGGMIGDTRLRTYDDGTRVVWKRSSTKAENDAEQLSSITARALGLRAPRIYRNDEREVNMDFVSGEMAALNPRVGYGRPPGHMLDSNEGLMIGLLDQLINNQDRHNGNWMIRDDGRLIPIDHGYAFTSYHGGRKLGPGQEPSFIKSPFGQHYSTTSGRYAWVSNDLTKADVAEIRQRLEKLRPDFEHLGRAAWHRFMMKRLDEIGKNAFGGKSRLLPPLV